MQVKFHCLYSIIMCYNVGMKISDVISILGGKLVAGGGDDHDVGSIVANDLMSDVLLSDSDDMLLLTSLASDQAVRTANIVGAVAVVVHNAKPLPETMCAVANALGVPLISSPLSKYEACVKLYLAKEAESRSAPK